MVAEGGWAAAHLDATLGHRGPWRETAPAVKAVGVEMMMFFHFRAGGPLEVWDVNDEFERRRQPAF
jgi:hypothetical protein